MDKTEALLKHLQDMAAWLEIEAGTYENGAARHFRGDVDDSEAVAASYRHRLGNSVSVIRAFQRLSARDGHS
jgi:hypothetical protein